jgi:cell division septation protein DedD
MAIKHGHTSRTDHETEAARDDEALPRSDAPSRFPVLDEPSWLDESDLDEMEAPRDSAFRGIWVGIAAAAATFVLVFAVPQWLGWYDAGPPTSRERHDVVPEAAISTVTAKPSGSRADARAPETVVPKEAAPPAPAANRAAAKDAGARAGRAAAADRDHSAVWVQIAAFKTPAQAGRLAARVKHDGYPAQVRRLRSAALPWVVWIGAYPSREQAEAARSTLVHKGFHDAFLR